MDKQAKIYIAGHRGMVGSVVVRALQAQGCQTILTRTHSELDLLDQAAVNAFFEAVQQAGYPLTDDVNGYKQEGFAAFDRNLHRGRRLSAARARSAGMLRTTNLAGTARSPRRSVLMNLP